VARTSWQQVWARSFQRSVASLTKSALKQGPLTAALVPWVPTAPAPTRSGRWINGVALEATGARRYYLFRPARLALGERLPLVVMLHGCGQDAKGFAQSAQMNSIATRERFLVLYPEQDRLANAQRCWNWFETRSGRAQTDMRLVLQAIDQACLLYGADRHRVAVMGLSAGASLAGLLVSEHPDRFKAAVMHSGVAPNAAHSSRTAWSAMQGRRSAVSPEVGEGRELPPVMVIQGGSDRVVAAINGRRCAEYWAEAKGALEAKPRTVQRGKRYPMTVTPFKVGSREEVTLLEIPALGHAWSGGTRNRQYSDHRGPNVSSMAWTFVSKRLQAEAARQFQRPSFLAR
jgi:poly(hydroxyalkanoate) depolymerase family esterase